MATDEAKKANAQRMMLLTMKVLISEVWDTLGDSSIALSHGMGDAILGMMEKEQGLEIAAEDPMAVGKEIERILVDEYGLAREIIIDPKSQTDTDLKVSGCNNTYFCDQLTASGVKTPFICPAMLATSAALRKLGYSGHVSIERWQEGKGCIVHFKGSK
jgi:hypothetical protein